MVQHVRGEVGYLGKTGPHLLIASHSHFDPLQTSVHRAQYPRHEIQAEHRRRFSTAAIVESLRPRPEPPTVVRPSRRVMADGLDVVPVRVEDEGAVIVLMVMWPDARSAIVAPTRRYRRLVEGIDSRAVLGTEGDMCLGHSGLSGADPEIR